MTSYWIREAIETSVRQLYEGAIRFHASQPGYVMQTEYVRLAAVLDTLKRQEEAEKEKEKKELYEGWPSGKQVASALSELVMDKEEIYEGGDEDVVV